MGSYMSFDRRDNNKTFTQCYGVNGLGTERRFKVFL